MDQVRRKTNATSAYQRHLTGKGVTVAFLDTRLACIRICRAGSLLSVIFRTGKNIRTTTVGTAHMWQGSAAGADSFPEASMPEWHREPGL